MEPLVPLISTWLSAGFGLPADAPGLAIRTLPEATLSRLWIESVAAEEGRDFRIVARQLGLLEIEAFYDHENSTIFLSDDWNPRSPRDISVLVHEIVHHLQRIEGQSYACPAAREKLAYDAQDAWLGLFGTSLELEFEIDPMTRLLSTKCMMH